MLLGFHFFTYIVQNDLILIQTIQNGGIFLSKKKEPMFQSGELVDNVLKGYYGMDPEQNLLSVNFSPAENQYLNEHYEYDSQDKENP